jgi:hypothetical protein
MVKEIQFFKPFTSVEVESKLFQITKPKQITMEEASMEKIEIIVDIEASPLSMSIQRKRPTK